MQPSLLDLEARLDPDAFVRVSRSALVQLSHVAEVVPQPSGGGEIVLRDGTRLPVSRRRLPEVLARLERSEQRVESRFPWLLRSRAPTWPRCASTRVREAPRRDAASSSPWSAWSCLLALAAAVAASSPGPCRSRSPWPARRAGGGALRPPERQRLRDPARRATVAAKVTGRVDQIDAEEGMTVEAGQVLARLDDSDASAGASPRWTPARAVAAASLKDLEVRLANAERDRTRAEGLERAGFASAQAADQAAPTSRA